MKLSSVDVALLAVTPGARQQFNHKHVLGCKTLFKKHVALMVSLSAL